MKKYIKMNDNDTYLSWGNFTRVIKHSAVNKSSALQIMLFCTIFNIDDINATTVNNYCIGCRSINDDYKQIMLNYKKRFVKDNNCLLSNIINLVSILDGNIYNSIDINIINKSSLLKEVCLKLYNISKNDKFVTNEFSEEIYKLLNNNLYLCIVKLLFYIVLDNKQPLYNDEIKNDIIEKLFINTNISAKDLEDYLQLKLNEGINYYHQLKSMADDGNAYACFELGTLEYKGGVKKTPRYNEALKYYKMASQDNYPNAYYMMGQILIKGLVGNKSNNDCKLALEYFNKAINLGNLSAYNSIGLMYKLGTYPLNKDKNKAKKYFMKASQGKYAYAYNNLGLLELENNNEEKAFEYFLLAAKSGESWACNKVGEYYRQGIIVDIDLDKAFYYYNLALDAEELYTCYYAYYNLAKYFYLYGNSNPLIKMDKEKAISYFKIASDKKIIEASIELFYIEYENYLLTGNIDSLNIIKKEIENNKDYNKNYQSIITKYMNNIKLKKELEINII